jgi:DNA polymerase-3 subunit beta
VSATVKASHLKAAVAWANRSVPSRTNVPVMACVGLRAEGGRLEAHGWDGGDLTSASIDADGDLDATYVHGRVLGEAVEKLDGAVTLAPNGSRLDIAGGRTRFSLAVADAGAYPSLPKRPEPSGTATGIAEAVRHVAHAADSNSKVVALTAVHLVARDGVLAAHATDRFIISRSECPWNGEDFTADVSAARLGGMASHLGEKVSITMGGTFSLDDGRLHASTLLIDERPPNYDGIFRFRWEFGTVDVDRAELLDAVKAVSPTARGNWARISLAIGAGEIVVTSDDQTYGGSETTAACSLDGDEQVVEVQPGLLSQALNATPSEVARIHLPPSPTKPFLVTGLDAVTGQPDMSTRHVVMPLREI